MNKVLVLGAGRSATALINYLLKHAAIHDWHVTVADVDYTLAKRKIGDSPHGEPVQLNINNVKARRKLIQTADVVVSLLPVNLHYLVVKDCIRFKRHLVTASYLSHEMYSLEAEIRDAAIMMVGEMGLDPGIDHMSAMQTIHRLRDEGCKLTAFRSYTGGLISPESIDNPWKYKFTWNPRNVVLAGQGTAQFLLNGRYKYIPYNRVFRQTTLVKVPGFMDLEAYLNRDSLLYKSIYGLENIPTLARYTFRYPGYCEAWNAFVKLGWTDDSYPILDSEKMTYRQLLASYLEGVIEIDTSIGGLKQRLSAFLGYDPDHPVMDKLEWLGIFEDRPIKLKNASPAMILQYLLLDKWSLAPDDHDQVVMQHEFEYEKGGKRYKLTSTMLLKGDDPLNTAMAKTVGLPIGIFVKLILEEKIHIPGIHIPVISDIYQPVLEELHEEGIVFNDHLEEIS